jgi:RNA recognition motif-containing protein
VKSKLYVGNISFQSTQDDIRQAFEAGGRTVTDVFIPTDRDTGRPRGFAFVEMGSPEEAQAAIEELNGTDLGGRTLQVNEARERENRGPRGGGGGGGGRW